MTLNKKGQISDIAYGLVTIFVVTICGVFSYYILSEFENTAGDVLDTNAQNVIDKAQAIYPLIDGMAIFLVASIFIVVIISAFFIKSHPIIIPIFVIGLVFLLYATAQISNVYEALINSDKLNETATDIFPQSTRIVFNLPTVGLFLGAVFILAFFAKWRGGQGGL